MSPVITATPEQSEGRIRISITAPAYSHVSVYQAVVTPGPYAWNILRSLALVPSDGTPIEVYDYEAPLNVETSYKALLFSRESETLLRPDEDYTETVTATLRTPEWRLK